MAYTPGEQDMVIPILSTEEGWADNKFVILEQVFTNYVTTYYKQSNCYRKDLRSLISALISVNIDSEANALKERITSDLLHLYSKYFIRDNIKIDVVILSRNDQEGTIDISIDVTCIDTNDPNTKYNLQKQIAANRSGTLALLSTRRNNILNMETNI